MNPNNFFDHLRARASEVALRHCEAQRLEVDLHSAKVMPIGPFKFQVRFTVMTPGGCVQWIFVQVEREGDFMVARHPFCNFHSCFNIQPFMERWFAPRPPSQQEVACAAVLRNWRAEHSD